LKENTPKATALKSGTTAPSTSAPVPTQPLTPVQEKLARNTNLASKLQQRLPAGTNLQEAALGFRNLGQFVAAVNVSHNLSIPFDQLKANMVTKHMSLGQSIQQLKPVASPTVEAQRAEYDAMTLISQNPEPSQTGSTTTAAPKKSTQRQ
jgi:hypothetical protein